MSIIGNRTRMAEVIQIAKQSRENPMVYEKIRALYPGLDDFTIGVIVGADYAGFAAEHPLMSYMTKEEASQLRKLLDMTFPEDEEADA